MKSQLKQVTRCVLIGAALMVILQPQATAQEQQGMSFRGARQIMSLAAAEAPSADRYARRLTTRAEHSLERFAAALTQSGGLWLSLLASTAVFLLFVAVVSVVDVRMVDLRRYRLRKFWDDLQHGVTLFFRIVFDRRTPNLARGLLVIGLLYWLAPVDLIPDSPLFPGFMDDLVVAAASSKAFVYFCPDAVVARHAHTVST
jgi:uncharacterized membrane protein YkvA (DUF1232 family)